MNSLAASNLAGFEALLLLLIVVVPALIVWWVKRTKVGPRQRLVYGGALLVFWLLATMISTSGNDAEWMAIPAVAAFFTGVILVVWSLVSMARKADQRDTP